MIETARLRLREWRIGEEALLTRFLSDERVMYAYEGAFSKGEVAHWLQWNLASYQEHGFGLWAMEDKATGKLLGECGLTWQVVEGEKLLEIGYHLLYEAWHQGYAQEAAQAVRDYALTNLGAEKVHSIVRDTNLASMNVAIRNGMTVEKRFVKEYKGVVMPHYLFAVEKPKNT